MTNFNPKELIVIRPAQYLKHNSMSKKELFSHLELEKYKHYYLENIDAKFFKLPYHTTFLETVFPESKLYSTSPLVTIGLDKSLFATISYIYLLDFSYQHDPQLLKNLK